MQIPAPETIKSIANETSKTNETPEIGITPDTAMEGLKTSEIGAGKGTTTTPTINNTPVNPITKTESHIVDKTQGETKLKPVSPGADKLTTLADEDEKHFIEGVEAVHDEHK